MTEEQREAQSLSGATVPASVVIAFMSKVEQSTRECNEYLLVQHAFIQELLMRVERLERSRGSGRKKSR